MVEIRTVKNPVTQMVTSAAAVFAIVTLLSGVIIGIAKPKDESAYKTAFSFSLVGLGCGAALGLLRSKPRGSIPASQTDPASAADPSWTNWRNFVVMRKVKESQDITSFYLRPEDQADIPNFQPGQFLTIKLDIPGQSRPTIRTYSLSDHIEACEYYRLSIKREPMPNGLEVPPGLASNFMHDQVQEGSMIQAKPPSGKFALDTTQTSPVVLISNGVGITPLISMAKASSRLNPSRPLWFIHGARDGSFHAFRDEILQIAQQNPDLRVHFRYSRPQMDDAERYHSMGYVDAALIYQLVTQEAANYADEAEYYLCGSPPFLRSLRDGLETLGIPGSRVFFEEFGGKKKVSPVAEATPDEISDGKISSAEIVFAKSEKTLTWKPGDGTILEFAEANDLNPPYSCRQGICLTCMCRLEDGEVTYVQPPVGTVEAGSALICISQPKTARVVLDL